MSTKTPTEVFKAIKDPELLEKIAEHRKLELSDKQRKQIVKHLAEDVSSTGVNKFLGTLSKKSLEALADKIDWEGKAESKHPPKTVFTKKISKQIQSVGAEKFWKSLPEAVLDKVIKETDIEVGGQSKIEAIIAESDSCGLEHCLSAFPIMTLHKFCDAAKLDVETQSLNTLIDSLMRLEDYAPPKKDKKKEPKPSKKKPEIKKGITKVDLQNWYNRTELAQYCEDQEIQKTGNKKDLIQRVIDYHDGKKVPKLRERASKKRKAEESSEEKKPKKKAKKEKSSKSEKDASESSSESSGKKKSKEKGEKKDKTESSEKGEDKGSKGEEKKGKEKGKKDTKSESSD